MQIKTRKIMIRGKQYRIITEVVGIKCKSELPEQYTDSSNIPKFYLLDSLFLSSKTDIHYYCVYFITNTSATYYINIPASLDTYDTHDIQEKFAITEETFQIFLKTVEEGIQKLKEVIASLPKWEGEETFNF